MSKKSEKNQFIFNLSSSKFNIIPLREITFKISLTFSLFFLLLPIAFRMTLLILDR